MNWLDTAISWVSPVTGLRRLRARRAAELVRLAYEGARIESRLDAHVIRRIGVDQVDRRAFNQAVYILAVRRIAAQQSMLGQYP